VAADPPRHGAGRAFPASPNLWRSLSPAGHRRGGWNRPTAASSRWLTRLARTALTPPGLEAARRLVQNASSRAGPDAFRHRETRLARVLPQIETRHTPFSSATPARPRQEPLGHHRARISTAAHSEDHTSLLTRDASSQLVHLTLSKTSTRAPRDDRPARGQPMEPPASRPRSRFGRWAPDPEDDVHVSVGPANQPLVPASPTGSPAKIAFLPTSQCRLCHLRVNDGGFHDTEHLPPACGPPRAVPSHPVLPPGSTSRRPFASGLRPRARSPWGPPAATGEPRLDQTSPADFCNHTEARAHRANAGTSHAVPFPARRRFSREARERRASGAEAPGQHREVLAAPVGVTRVSVRAAAAEANSSLPGRPCVAKLPRWWSPNPPATPPDQGLPSGQPRERGEPSRRPEAPSTAREPGRSANRAQPSHKRLRESASTRPRLFHGSGRPTMTGGATDGPRRDTSEDRLATSPFRGAPRRP
jgi:hypothetical protein